MCSAWWEWESVFIYADGPLEIVFVAVGVCKTHPVCLFCLFMLLTMLTMFTIVLNKVLTIVLNKVLKDIPTHHVSIIQCN